MRRILVCGDIHGNYKGLKQALERSNFDYENDTLISLGDVVDGHSQSFEVVEELLKIKNLIAIKGNHDDWFNNFLVTGRHSSDWHQGAKATGMSYLAESRPNTSWYGLKFTPGGGEHFSEAIIVEDIPESHVEFFKNQLPYYIDSKNRLFIHGGFDRTEKLIDQNESNFWWNRDLWKDALKTQKQISAGLRPLLVMVEDFKEIFIGHTSTQFEGVDIPMNACNIWNLDTGGGWHGFVSIMDVDTKEFWQSDTGKELYPEFKGR